MVVVSTELTPELEEEGLVRELIHHVQGQRKQQDLAYEERITLLLETSPELLEIVNRHAETVSRECLVDGIETAIPADLPAEEAKVAEHAVKLAIRPQ